MHARTKEICEKREKKIKGKTQKNHQCLQKSGIICPHKRDLSIKIKGYLKTNILKIKDAKQNQNKNQYVTPVCPTSHKYIYI